MASAIDLKKNAFATGKYYLLDIDYVLEIYKESGYDIEDDETTVPTHLEVNGESCFFTGDFIRRNEKYYEIVIISEGFSWDEVENEEDGEIADGELP